MMTKSTLQGPAKAEFTKAYIESGNRGEGAMYTLHRQ